MDNDPGRKQVIQLLLHYEEMIHQLLDGTLAGRTVSQMETEKRASSNLVQQQLDASIDHRKRLMKTAEALVEDIAKHPYTVRHMQAKSVRPITVNRVYQHNVVAVGQQDVFIPPNDDPCVF